MPDSPTVVLVHGAFADASSWNGVVERLQAQGVSVTAPPNPLRGIAIDSAYTVSVLEQIEGPILLVGHSYGGAVITNAGAKVDNVVGLVYVCAFAPDEGELLGQLAASSKDSILGPFQIGHHYPNESGALLTELTVDPAGFHEAFAADLPEKTAAVMAATQRPVSELGFSEPTGTPAWRTLPSWAVVATGDKAAGADLTRRLAERAGAAITELPGSHVVMVSQPQAVSDVILKAVAAASSEPAVV
jgi:pimeloyl-ACP methyl ester carboxylesterase